MSAAPSQTKTLLSGRIPGLDGLRAISILLVLVSHFGFGDLVPGALGVTIFFFISGFLITALLLEERDSKGSISIGSFYIRRFLRLGPELVVLLVVVSAIDAILRIPIRAQDYVAALTYTTNYVYLWELAHFDRHFLHWPHMWSLAVEEHFYLTYPLLFAVLAAQPKRFGSVLIALCVICLCWRATALTLNFVRDYTYVASDSRFDSIAYGCLFALLLRSEAFVRKAAPWGLLLIAAGMALMMFSLVYRDPFFRETFRYSIQGLAVGLGVTGMLASPSGALVLRVLEIRPLIFLGQLSYGAYLWHLDVLGVYGHFMGGEPKTLAAKAALTIGGSVVSFTIAYLSYTFVAKRFLALRKRFRGHPENQTAETPAGAGIEPAKGPA